MESDSFHGVLTDPPYGLGFMEKDWDRLPSVDVWREVLRVCKPGASLLAFGGTKTYHRLACRIEDAGWEVRDGLMWLHGEGMPKGQNIAKGIDKKLGAKRKVIGTRPNVHRGVNAEHRWGFSPSSKPIDITAPATREAEVWDGYSTALKPAWEPIVLAMKPRRGTFAENVLVHGCGGLNVDGCRIGTSGATQRSHQAAYPRNADGTEDRSKSWARTGHKVESVEKGRWPANVILDEEAAHELDRQNPCSRSQRSVRRRDGSPVGNGKTLHPFVCVGDRFVGYDDEGGPSRFFYCAKASAKERDGNTHPTVKPLKLCQYLARLILPPAGFRRLLVPYCGSGSEMLAALRSGWDFVTGIEQESKYLAIARKRLASFDAA